MIKRIVIIGIIVVFLLPALLITISFLKLLLGGFMCGSEVSEESYSLDGTYYFQVEQFDCGATTRYYSDVMLSKPFLGVTIPGLNKHSVFGYEGTIDMVEVEWIDRNVISINDMGVKARGMRDHRWKEVEVRYR